MVRLIERLKSMWRHNQTTDRRTSEEPVAIDRRARKVTLRDADDVLHEAMERLERTAIRKREEFFKE